MPVVVFHEIVNTNNYNLLCTDKFITEDLESIWDKLFEEYQKLTQGFSYEYMFGIRKKASSLMAKYQSVQVACNALLVTDDKELKEQLKEWGFDVSTFEKIEKVRRNSESILINAQIQESKLPKRDENAESKSVDIYESLATFMTILGIDLDFKSISVRKYIALEKAIDKKFKANA